jgi:Na+/H+ antiporter NhaD/arsenite permease-like protein
MLTIILILLILLAFILMTKRILKQEVAMPLLALTAIFLAGNIQGIKALNNGFAEFSRIAILFTAVAVPAHILQRSKLLDLVGVWIGEIIGKIYIRTNVNICFLVSAFSLLMVYIMAALFHNTTSILVSAVIIYVICKSYKLKALPVLCGALVASNLGGFSTRWGDTPNIIEASLWGLSHKDFLFEIMPINICALFILIAIVSIWLSRATNKDLTNKTGKFETTFAMIKFRNANREISLDNRLVFFGLLGLALAIVGPIFFTKFELGFSSLAIIVSVLGDYSDHRAEGLLALGIETYAVLVSIFVLAQVLSRSDIGVGNYILDFLMKSHMSIWAIALASYFGTLLTEAASWASAVAPVIHAQASTHAAAWALGSGIFAGSSSLVTAASAGIILTNETKENPEKSRIVFGSYVLFGLLFSISILAYYILILSLFFK